MREKSSFGWRREGRRTVPVQSAGGDGSGGEYLHTATEMSERIMSAIDDVHNPISATERIQTSIH